MVYTSVWALGVPFANSNRNLPSEGSTEPELTPAPEANGEPVIGVRLPVVASALPA